MFSYFSSNTADDSPPITNWNQIPKIFTPQSDCETRMASKGVVLVLNRPILAMSERTKGRDWNVRFTL